MVALDIDDGVVVAAGVFLIAGIVIGIPIGFWLSSYVFYPRQPSSYENQEKWEIVRNEKGRITEGIVHRNAAENE